MSITALSFRCISKLFYLLIFILQVSRDTSKKVLFYPKRLKNLLNLVTILLIF